jgi:hypothetical protein
MGEQAVVVEGTKKLGLLITVGSPLLAIKTPKGWTEQVVPWTTGCELLEDLDSMPPYTSIRRR